MSKALASTWRVACGFMLCALFFSLTGCQSELFGSLDENDANAVLDVLYAEGIEAEKVPGDSSTWRVKVSAEEHQRALHVTRKAGVPRERFANMGQLFKKEGLVSSPSEERLRYIFAVSQELAATLSQIDGVISARVHPVIPANDPLSDTVRPASAAVFIKHKADADLQQMAPAIKNLVTRSIEGLKADQVSLTFFATRVEASAVPPTPQKAKVDSALIAIASILAVCLAIALIALGFLYKRHLARSNAAKATLSDKRLTDKVVRPFRQA